MLNVYREQYWSRMSDDCRPSELWPDVNSLSFRAYINKFSMIAWALVTLVYPWCLIVFSYVSIILRTYTFAYQATNVIALRRIELEGHNLSSVGHPVGTAHASKGKIVNHSHPNNFESHQGYIKNDTSWRSTFSWRLNVGRAEYYSLFANLCMFICCHSMENHTHS